MWMGFIVPRLVGNDPPDGRFLRTASAKREDAACGLVLVYTLMVLPIVIWIMHEPADRSANWAWPQPLSFPLFSAGTNAPSQLS